LRIELKFVKMHDLKPIGIRSLGDLKAQTLEKAHTLLVQKFNEVMAYDYTINKSLLSNIERKYSKSYSNPRFWLFELKPNHRHRHKKSLFEIINKYSDNLQLQILKLIQEEIKATGNSDRCVINNRGDNDEVCVINNSSNIGLESIDVAKGYTNKKSEINKRFCLITGLDISMQKTGSFLLSYCGLRHYQANEPTVFNEIMQRYLTTHWAEADIATQIKEIAHNIRTIKKNQKRKQKRIYPNGQIKLFDFEKNKT